MASLLAFSLVSSLIAVAQAELGGIHASDDLLSFKSRPDLRPPKFYVKKHHPDQVASGYFFTGPYAHSTLSGEGIWAACQAGPAIYDSDGELVWTGGCEYGTTYDFKVSDCDGQEGGCMSFNIRGLNWPDGSKHGTGVILDNTYQVKKRVAIDQRFDLHEWNVLPGGRTALYINNNPREYSFADMGFDDDEYLRWTSLNEVDLETGDVIFRWETPEHLGLSQSTFHPPHRQGTKHRDNPWDFDHVNSIDKNEDGDYLASFRHANCVMKISGKDGSVMWQLGGTDSDLKFAEGLHFTRQHHARFIESRKDYSIISILDNASGKYGRKDDEPPSHDFSRGLLIKVHHPNGRPTTAETYREYGRPDGELTELRGSLQILKNGNVFAGWSKGGYQSEHAEDGTLLEESGFVSGRYDTYRSYKYDFVGHPHERPHVVAEVFGVSTLSVLTVFYVSWNGATEVKTWNFYEKEGGQSTFLGNATKTGFETMWMYEGYTENVWAEGLDRDGNVLGETKVAASIIPDDWRAAGFSPDEKIPSLSRWAHVGEWKEKLKSQIAQKVQFHEVDFPVVIFALVPLGALALWLGRRRLCAPILRTTRRRLSGYRGLAQDEMSSVA